MSVTPLIRLASLAACLLVPLAYADPAEPGFSKGALLLADNSSNSVTQERDVPDYSRIQSMSSLDVVYTVSSRRNLQVIAPASMQMAISTKVSGDQLIITGPGHQNVKVVATGPSLRGISLYGSGDMKVLGLQGGTFTVTIDGSGDAIVTGAVDLLKVVVHGSGDVDTTALRAYQTKIDVAGSGDVKAQATYCADVSVAGSGDVSVLGRPAQQLVHKMGSGDIVFP